MDYSTTVTDAILADWLDLSIRRISDLEREGTIFRAADGGFDLRVSVRGYTVHQRARTKSEGVAAERKRLLTEQANREAPRNAATRRELLPAADVEHVWEVALIGLRQELLAIPGRLAQETITVAAVDAAIRTALTALGEPDGHGL